MLKLISTLLRNRIPLTTRLRLRQKLRRYVKPAWLGTLRRTGPLSEVWGHDRGTPVDRYYIEKFLEKHRQDIRGRVLEVKDSGYTVRFGNGVTKSDVLDIDPSNPLATVIADLSAADQIPAEQFDTFILTQTLQFIYDTRAVLRHSYRLLRPGGVLLVTVPCLSRLDRQMSDYWRFTADSCRELFGEIFGPENLKIEVYGNVLTGIGSLTGMALEEFSVRELEAQEKLFPLLIGVRAVKTSATPN